MDRRVGGQLFVKVDGIQQQAKGEFTYNLGALKREPVVGVDSVHGYSEVPQVPKIEGEFTDFADFDLEALLNISDATIVLEVANGKIVVLREAWYAGDGDVATNEGNIQVMFNGISCEEIR